MGAGAGAAQQLAEGVLYYGGQGADGLHVSDYITECTSKSELDDFIQSCAAPQSAPDGFVGDIEVPCDKQLAVVDIGMDKNAPAGCMNIFPAVLSLARNTMGFTRWARIAVDANAECKDIAKHFNVTQVPAFVFLAGGVVVDTYQVRESLGKCKSACPNPTPYYTPTPATLDPPIYEHPPKLVTLNPETGALDPKSTTLNLDDKTPNPSNLKL